DGARSRRPFDRVLRSLDLDFHRGAVETREVILVAERVVAKLVPRERERAELRRILDALERGADHEEREREPERTREVLETQKSEIEDEVRARQVGRR